MRDTEEFKIQQLVNPPKAQLQEIYNLRVEAWQEAGVITKDKYPNGWSDELDADAIHWVARNKEGKVIAAIRTVILNSLEEFPQRERQTFEAPEVPKRFPMAYTSKLFVTKPYRGNGIGAALESCCFKYTEEQNVPFTIMVARGPRIQKFLEEGFQFAIQVPSHLLIHPGRAEVIYKLNK